MQLAKLAIASMALSFVSLLAVAEEPRDARDVDALLQSSYTTINGRETPELIPYHIRMGMFFSSFSHHAPELRAQLSTADFDKLEQFANDHESTQKQDADRQLREWKEVAARAEAMSAVEIATELKQSSSRIEDAAAARYRATLNGLSPEGKVFVDRFIAERIRPTTAIEDPLIVANAAPIFYKAQILAVYQLMLEGKWPPASPTNGERTNSSPSENGTRIGSN